MKLCVIGAGRMGRRHIFAARKVGFSLAGIFDSSPEALLATINECNVEESLVFADVQMMLDTVAPDAVVVSTTAPSHCDYVLASVAAGVQYILCEKPMASSLEECDRMIAACRGAGAKLAINHQMRFMEQYIDIKALTETPEFGGLRSMVVTASNFGLAMNGCHYFEAFRYLTNEEVTEISCWFDPNAVPNPRGPQYVDRSGQLRGITASGGRLIIELGADLGHGIEVIYGCRNGQILVDELAGFVRGIHRLPEYRDLPTTRYGMPAKEFQRKIAQADVTKPTEDLWRAMLSGDLYPTGENGRHAIAVLVAANLSGESGGRTVVLGNGLPIERKFMWA
ncbi:Gfo/Idh/MocA family oxidoreductase [Bradyrhizobium japonicum]|uniref:Gfo/Idh/MocA family protein n=1 Tax=Bradyrhizobium japonicum TaxID=375 RepID=UPI001BA611AF|nr:Gfo/Idh/MocA family oxidoreductase [Bradyrhizobium japonicum]MBR0994710.1 Gfo/Idh/MocA family oxidoreductase [Bradyrhizobium japonicum]